MKSFKTETKELMQKLLKEDIFDKFLVRNVLLISFAKFEISGPVFWVTLKPIILNIIKGAGKPKNFRIVFILDEENTAQLHENASNFSLNMNFSGEEVFFTTGTSEKNFSLDKSIEYVWENYITDFFKTNKIIMEEL
ncbi:MAG: DUF5721 family protein [Defluviitaleaceae bacterium]|nr:DUF5721 family protein [Defluviitaleaceae bacterium]